MSAGETIARVRDRQKRVREKHAELWRMNQQRALMGMPMLDEDLNEIPRLERRSPLRDLISKWWSS